MKLRLKFSGMYFCARLRLKNVSAFPIHNCWRASALARSYSMVKKMSIFKMGNWFTLLVSEENILEKL